MILSQLTEYWEKQGCCVRLREPLSCHTTFRIGGPADALVTVRTAAQAATVLGDCAKQSVPVKLIGNGSNLLVSDGGVEGVVLQWDAAETALEFDEGRIIAPSGYALSRLCLAAAEHGLSGLEFAYGIPGSVGGGVYMNAGAYDGQLSDVINWVKVLDSNVREAKLGNADMHFAYRHSLLMEKPLMAVSVEFSLHTDDPTAIRERMNGFLNRRRAKQPLEYPSAGSFFKRPTGFFAGSLIEQCGLKGLTVGGAQVSEKHAGFVINRGGATCADVLELSRRVTETVQEHCGVVLEREVQLIGR